MMTENEAIILGLIAQNMRQIKALAGLLRKETEQELNDTLIRYRYPINFQDYAVMERIVMDVAARHGHRNMGLVSLVDLIPAKAGA